MKMKKILSSLLQLVPAIISGLLLLFFIIDGDNIDLVYVVSLYYFFLFGIILLINALMVGLKKNDSVVSYIGLGITTFAFLVNFVLQIICSFGTISL